MRKPFPHSSVVGGEFSSIIIIVQPANQASNQTQVKWGKQKMSSTNKNFATAMRHLQEEDPTTYEAINKKIQALKAEAASWRRKTLNTSPSTVTEKKPLTMS